MYQISVLVAVYNSSKYIRRCIDSLLAQTLKDIQIICIDDCSTDNSLNILHEYAAKDKRIEVIALSENRGQAHARNEGLKQAEGKYITFVDSDDWLAPDALQQSVDVFAKDDEIDSVLFDVVIYHNATTKQEAYPMPFSTTYPAKRLFWQALHGAYTDGT